MTLNSLKGAIIFLIKWQVQPGIVLESLTIIVLFAVSPTASLLDRVIKLAQESREDVDFFLNEKLHLHLLIVGHGLLSEQLRELVGPEHVHAGHLLVTLLRWDFWEVAEVRVKLVNVFAHPESLHFIIFDVVREEQ